MVSEYERQEIIKKNEKLLASLGLYKPLFEPKVRPASSTQEPKKRKNLPQSEQSESEEPGHKFLRIIGSAPDDGPQRSSRHTGKAVDYKKSEQSVRLPRLAALASVIKHENEAPHGQGGKRIHNPKTYGQITGIEVGTGWESRRGCSGDAIHAPWVGDITIGPQGAGREDGANIGSNLKGTSDKPNLRTAPQNFDQDFENKFNEALLSSSETKKPVRVVRDFEISSKHAPYEGYRFDGLYRVERAWEERDNTEGQTVCKFAFKRLPDQPVTTDMKITTKTETDTPLMSDLIHSNIA